MDSWGQAGQGVPHQHPLTLLRVLRAPVAPAGRPPAPCQPRTHLVFLKTHKTGGSSVVNLLHRFGEARGLRFALPHRYQFGYPSPFRAERVKGYRPGGPPFDIICHHMRFNLTEVPGASGTAGMRQLWWGRWGDVGELGWAGGCGTERDGGQGWGGDGWGWGHPREVEDIRGRRRRSGEIWKEKRCLAEPGDAPGNTGHLEEMGDPLVRQTMSRGEGFPGGDGGRGEAGGIWGIWETAKGVGGHWGQGGHSWQPPRWGAEPPPRFPPRCRR